MSVPHVTREPDARPSAEAVPDLPELHYWALSREVAEWSLRRNLGVSDTPPLLLLLTEFATASGVRLLGCLRGGLTRDAARSRD